MTCTHRWRIAERPEGNIYPAQCGLCGATKAFPRDAEWSYGQKGPLSRPIQEVNGIPLRFKPFAWGPDGLVKGRAGDYFDD